MLSTDRVRHSHSVVFLLGGLVALAPFAIDAYLPALPSMATEFGVSMVSVNLTLTAYMLGNGVGQFFGGALSDHLGRRPVALAGLLVFLLSSFAITFAPSVEAIQLLRFCQAIGGGFAAVICVAQLRDIYPPEEVTRYVARMMMVMMIAPLVAPVLGVALLAYGWQMIFVFLAVYAVLFFLLYATLMPETLTTERRKPRLDSMLAGYRAVLVHRSEQGMRTIRVALFSAFIAGIFLSYLTNAASIYIDVLKFSEFQFALIFAATAVVMMVGNWIATRLMGRFRPLQILKTISLLQVAVALLVALLTWVFSNQVVIIFSGLLLMAGLSGVLYPTASGFYISFFEHHSGSAASLNSTLRLFIGSFLGALAVVLGAQSLVPIFLVMAAAGITAILLLPASSEPSPQTP